MSHLVKVPAQVTQFEGVRRACSRLGIEAPVVGKATIFGQECEGTIVKLNGWCYPIVCDLQSGEVHYDNYGGHWGQQEQLDQFLQGYAVETAKMTAEQQGYQVTEELLADGSIGLNVMVTH